MARLIVDAVHADGELRRWTLGERVAAENLDSEHYTAQLLERVRWATADAEALESPSAVSGRPRPPLPRPDSDGQPGDRLDAAWLYAWSAQGPCSALGERLSVRGITAGQAASSPVGRVRSRDVTQSDTSQPDRGY